MSTQPLLSGRNLLISGGTFNQFNSPQSPLPDQTGIHLLSQSILPGAIHDSSARYPPPRCRGGKHRAVVTDIINWVCETSPSTSILWLHGPEGAGKTTVAQTIAELCHAAQILGGSFFFTRPGHDSDSHSANPRGSGAGPGHKLFPTLAYQLATNIAALRAPISRAVARDPTLPTKSLGVQLHALIAEPCAQVCAAGADLGTLRRPVVVIDALDACGPGAETQRDILLLLAHAVRTARIPLRFVITTRTRLDAESRLASLFRHSSVASLTRELSVVPPNTATPAVEGIPPFHNGAPKATPITGEPSHPHPQTHPTKSKLPPKFICPLPGCTARFARSSHFQGHLMLHATQNTRRGNSGSDSNHNYNSNSNYNYYNYQAGTTGAETGFAKYLSLQQCRGRNEKEKAFELKLPLLTRCKPRPRPRTRTRT